MKRSLFRRGVIHWTGTFWWATFAGQAAQSSGEVAQLAKPFARVAMLWASIRGDNSNEAMARHDLVLVGSGTLRLKYDRQPPGLADGFTPESVGVARERVKRIRQLTPGVIVLGEMLFYEWPDSWLPETHPWWLRKNDQRQQFWPGTHRMNWYDPEYRRQVVRQTVSLQGSGLDGVFYDNLREEPEPWVSLLKEVRQQVGEHFLILANCGYSVGKHDFAATFRNGFMYESSWSHGLTEEWTDVIRKMQHSELLAVSILEQRRSVGRSTGGHSSAAGLICWRIRQQRQCLMRLPERFSGMTRRELLEWHRVVRSGGGLESGRMRDVEC
jgi:hypothetical protein